MESRVHTMLHEYFAGMDERINRVLEESGLKADGALPAALRSIVTEAVREAIEYVRMGKSVHERFVQHVVLHAVDSIIGVDKEEKIFFWNKGAERTFGYTQDEVLGKTYDFLIPEGEVFRNELERLHTRTWNSGFIRDHHTQRVARDGRLLMVSLSRTLLRDEDGNVLGVIAILRDMSQQRLLERQIAQNEKLALIGRIAAGVAHEMGAPLNIISGIAEMLLLDRPPGHPEHEDLETVIGQTDRIARLIRELLAFARPQPLRRDSVDLCEELRRALALVKGRLDKHAIETHVDAPQGLPRLDADPHQLQQVFLNLLLNSVDAIAEARDSSSRRIDITLCCPEPGAVEMSFADSGPGIRADILPRIFEPFVTSKDTGKGTGLGLAVCRRIMEDHKGSISAGNSAAGGAVFTVTFPARET